VVWHSLVVRSTDLLMVMPPTHNPLFRYTQANSDTQLTPNSGLGALCVHAGSDSSESEDASGSSGSSSSGSDEEGDNRPFCGWQEGGW
jgi:hypothetical protein